MYVIGWMTCHSYTAWFRWMLVLSMAPHNSY
jgi:hypothetical protein